MNLKADTIYVLFKDEIPIGVLKTSNQNTEISDLSSGFRFFNYSKNKHWIKDTLSFDENKNIRDRIIKLEKDELFEEIDSPQHIYLPNIDECISQKLDLIHQNFVDSFKSWLQNRYN